MPRLRTATFGDYLSAGLAYAFHLHRDTWYSAPHCQLNWWLPVYDIEPDNCMAFHPRYWAQAVRNDSRKYNYYEWNATSRKIAAEQVKSDTREQPHALEPLDPEPQIRLICKPGGMILFSGAQMHSTVPNTFEDDPFLDRLPHREPGRRARDSAARRTRTRPARARRCGTTSARPTSRDFPTISCGSTMALPRPPASSSTSLPPSTTLPSEPAGPIRTMTNAA